MAENQRPGGWRHVQLPHSRQNLHLRSRGGGQHHHRTWRRSVCMLSPCLRTISAKQFQEVHVTPLLLCEQELRALPVSPSSLDMAPPSPSTGPMGIPDEHLSPVMLLRPDPQVRLCTNTHTLSLMKLIAHVGVCA